MLQTDLMMLAPLGEVSLAAFGVPMRVMWIDLIVALALIPVASVHISSICNEEDRYRAVSNILGAAFYLSIILMFVCFFIYPKMIHFMIQDKVVAKLSQEAVFWLTLSIPIRLNMSLNQMFLFSTGSGQSVNIINLLALLANVLLNWLLIYVLSMGFQGAYIATVLVSLMQCLGGLFIMRRNIMISQIFKSNLNSVKKLFLMMSPEFLRLIAWNLMWFISLALFASYLGNVERLAAYSVFVEFQFFVTMPLVVFMRTTAIYLSKKKLIDTEEQYDYISKLAFKGLFMIILISVLLWFSCSIIGENFYKLNGDALAWWKAGMQMLALTFILLYWNALQRGVWQSRKAFKLITLLEIVFYWSLFIPGIYFGLKYSNPYLPWLGSFFAELIIGLYLWSHRNTYAEELQEKLI
jgi:Na+-driven multidrug efflux pump